MFRGLITQWSNTNGNNSFVTYSESEQFQLPAGFFFQMKFTLYQTVIILFCKVKKLVSECVILWVESTEGTSKKLRLTIIASTLNRKHFEARTKTG